MNGYRTSNGWEFYGPYIPAVQVKHWTDKPVNRAARRAEARAARKKGKA